jgi:hypothetical protein
MTPPRAERPVVETHEQGGEGESEPIATTRTDAEALGLMGRLLAASNDLSRLSQAKLSPGLRSALGPLAEDALGLVTMFREALATPPTWLNGCVAWPHIEPIPDDGLASIRRDDVLGPERPREARRPQPTMDWRRL